jgi:hypothetical protein
VYRAYPLYGAHPVYAAYPSFGYASPYPSSVYIGGSNFSLGISGF